MLVVDGANVVGARPDGWWKDRAGAARRLHEALLVADVPQEEVVLVLEGAAKGGARAGRDAHVRVVHASGEGDATIVAQAPKMAPHIPAMRERIAASLGIPVERVNVKAKTAEKMGPVGEGRAIEARAVVLLAGC